MNTKELEKQTTQLPTTVHALAVVDRASYEQEERRVFQASSYGHDFEQIRRALANGL